MINCVRHPCTLSRFRHGTTSAFGASCLTKDFQIRKSAICVIVVRSFVKIKQISNWQQTQISQFWEIFIPRKATIARVSHTDTVVPGQPDLPLCQCRAVCHPPHTASSILGCSILTGLQGTPPHSPTFMSAFLSPPRSPLNREDDWEEGSYCSAQHGNAYYIAFNTSIQLTYFF